DVLADRLQHFADEIHQSVAGGLAAHERTTPVEPLAGQHPGLVPVGDALVLAEQIPDLALAHADIAGRHVGVLTEMPVQLRHVALAEAHHLGVAVVSRVEVGPALRAANRHAGQGILERLLEPEELDDAQVHRLLEPEAALVGPEGAVECDAESAVDADRAVVVLPWDAEDDLALGLAQPVDHLVIAELRILRQYRAERSQDLEDSLMEFTFSLVALDESCVEVLEFFVDGGHSALFLEVRNLSI